jgi:hypothetical protein
VEIQGQTVPAGSAMLFIIAAANRDERRYPDPDRFDIHRDLGLQLTFGVGIHYCLGMTCRSRSRPERLEGRPFKKNYCCVSVAGDAGGPVALRPGPTTTPAGEGMTGASSAGMG